MAESRAEVETLGARNPEDAEHFQGYRVVGQQEIREVELPETPVMLDQEIHQVVESFLGENLPGLYNLPEPVAAWREDL